MDKTKLARGGPLNRVYVEKLVLGERGVFVPDSETRSVTWTSHDDKYKRFLPMAHACAAMSKVPGTKVGCMILGQEFEVRSSGWNGAPRGSSADVDRRSLERDERLQWVCHAEANAIANAARSGTSLRGTTMIVTLMPCMTCAKLAVQAGVTQVICPKPSQEMEQKWSEDFRLSRELFKECSVRLLEIDAIEHNEQS